MREEKKDAELLAVKAEQEAPTQPMGGGKGFEAREVIKKPYFPDDCEKDSPLFDF